MFVITKNDNFVKSNVVMFASIIFLGMVLSTLLSLLVYESLRREAGAENQQRTARIDEQVVDQVARRFRATIFGLSGLKGVVFANGILKRQEFGVAVLNRGLSQALTLPAIDSAWLALIGGNICSLLLAFAMYLRMRGMDRVLVQNRQMMADTARLAGVARNTAKSVIITDAARRITWVNRGFECITGYTAHEVTGTSPGLFLQCPATDKQVVQKMRACLDRGQGFCGQVLNRRKDGSQYWVELEIEPQYDESGQLSGFISIECEHGAQHMVQAELGAALRENDALLGALNQHLIVSSVDGAGLITDVNDAFCRISGYNKKDLLGGDHRILHSGQHDAAFWRAMWHDIATGLPWHGHICNRARNGSLFWLDTLVVPCLDANGKVEKYLAIHYDITEAKSCAASLLVAQNADREEHGHEDESALQAARDVSRAKAEFLANMSHEIRTPINAVLGMINLLQKTDLSARQADYAAKTEGAARSLLGLVDEIFDFSRIEAGKMALELRPFSIEEILRNLSVIFAADLGSKPVELLFELDPGLPQYLLGDAMRLQQVLIKLGGNAIKFTERGEVVLSVQVVARQLDAVILKIGVRDSGIGIAEEDHARIFSGLTQAETSTTRRFGGSGLGVTISHRLVQLMGAELKLSSSLGHGSHFYFELRLPLLIDPGPESVSAAVGSNRNQSGDTPMLVLMAHPGQRAQIARWAHVLGWSPVFADTADQVLACLQSRAWPRERFRAILIDWNAPGVSPLRLCQQIALQEGQTMPHIIALGTALDRDLLSRQSADEQAVVQTFLVKPVTTRMLDEVVRSDLAPAQGPPEARVPRLRGLCLLVAEDNLNNQQVVRELLASEGAQVHLVGNGEEAVAAVASSLADAGPLFDAVLMDLHMPVMDGLDATRAIRQQLRQERLPIIAMTANVMPTDRAICLAAGMNEYVGKPFELKHLIQVLCQQTGRAQPVEPPEKGDLTLPQALLLAAQQAGVELSKALIRMGGRRDVYLRTLQHFVDSAPATVIQLQESMQHQDASATRQGLHTLKGLTATLGMTDLSAMAAQLEGVLIASALTGPMQVTPSFALSLSPLLHILDSLGPGWPPLCQALQQSLPAPEPSAPQSGSAPFSLKAALQALLLQLQDSDMAATQSMRNIMRQCEETADGAALQTLQPLYHAVISLDFSSAIQLCQPLIESEST
jgi:PAS domain S-box-containing protein